MQHATAYKGGIKPLYAQCVSEISPLTCVPD